MALEGIISVAQQAPRIVFMRAFAPYFEGKPSGLNPPSIIRATKMFQVGHGQLIKLCCDTLGLKSNLATKLVETCFFPLSDENSKEC